MKKFAKIMAVALVAVMAIAVLAACGYPSDPAKAAEQLEKKGYEVVAVIGSDSAEGKIAQLGLDMMAAGMGLEEGDITATITASKEDGKKGEMISIIYFKDAATAKKAYDDMKDDIKEEKEAYEEMGLKYSCKRSGNQIIAKMSGEMDAD